MRERWSVLGKKESVYGMGVRVRERERERSELTFERRV